MTTPSEKGISRLAYQFVDSEKLIQFLEVFLAEKDELYDSEQQLLDERYLATAVGVQLDGIGEILGLERPEVSGSPATDDLYRLLLRAKALINTTNMTVDETTEIISFTFGGVSVKYVLPVILFPYYYIEAFIDPSLYFVFTIFPLLICIGDVQYISYLDPEETFSFSDDPTGKGWGTTADPLVGGNFATLITQ